MEKSLTRLAGELQTALDMGRPDAAATALHVFVDRALGEIRALRDPMRPPLPSLRPNGKSLMMAYIHRLFSASDSTHKTPIQSNGRRFVGIDRGRPDGDKTVVAITTPTGRDGYDVSFAIFDEIEEQRHQRDAQALAAIILTATVEKSEPAPQCAPAATSDYRADPAPSISSDYSPSCDSSPAPSGGDF
jgi:hypothetical protein